MGRNITWGNWEGDMEWYYSFARDARFNRRPWRKLLWRLMGILRGPCARLSDGTFRLFVVIANLHDVLELDEDTEE
jgi:hypothetical protein